MKENTVLLNIKDYNNLRDFKKDIEKGKYVMLGFDHYHSASESEIVTELKNIISELKDEIRSYENPKHKSIYEVKEMNLWQLIKWWFKK